MRTLRGQNLLHSALFKCSSLKLTQRSSTLNRAFAVSSRKMGRCQAVENFKKDASEVLVNAVKNNRDLILQ